MKKSTVKLRWVLWVHIEKYVTNYYRKTRGANFFEFVKWGYKVNIGMPWAEPFVEYEVTHQLGIGVKGIEKNNKEILSNNKGICFYMPSVKYKLNTP